MVNKEFMLYLLREKSGLKVVNNIEFRKYYLEVQVDKVNTKIIVKREYYQGNKFISKPYLIYLTLQN